MDGAWDSSHSPSRLWRSGRWSMELRDDEIADLAFDGTPVLRSIRAVVRDRDWNTAGWVIEQVSPGADVLELVLRSTGYGSDVRGTLRAEASGDHLAVSFVAVSRTRFETNRTGLVVLHPPALAGHDLLVTHPDGSQDATAFPLDISPHQPVEDIAGLAWDAGGLTIRTRFTGDVFEMEDQRNWTDASYKTYSRPLALPFPYVLEEGETVEQSVEVTVGPGRAQPAPSSSPDRVVLRHGGTFPEVTVSASTAPDPAPAHPPIGSSLLVELDLATAGWRAALERAAAEGLPLDVRFVLPEDRAALEEGVRAVRAHPLARVSAFWPTGPARHVSDEEAIRLLRSALAAAGLSVPVVGGARSHFTELNREHHRLPHDLDGIVFSVTPLFHSLTTEQLVESVAMQRVVARQAVRLAGGRPVHVGPVTLRPRFNDVATSPLPASPHEDLAEGYGAQLADADDARQSSPELAAWTIASAAALSVPGVATLTFYEEWGPRGVRTAGGAALPVAEALHALAVLSGSRLLHGDSPDGRVWAVGGETDETVRVLVANLTDSERTVTVELPSAGGARTVEVVVPARSFVGAESPTV